MALLSFDPYIWMYFGVFTQSRPFLVEGMWHDGRFTYLRSNAQESAALYEIKDGKPALVAYDLEEDGLYIARHVLGDEWLQIGKQKVKWSFTKPGIRP